MNKPLTDSELRDKINQLRRERDAHQMDESDYADAVVALVRQQEDEAVQKFAKGIQDKVDLEFAAGGRYPGHIIQPWEDVVRPIINKAALRSQQKKSIGENNG